MKNRWITINEWLFWFIRVQPYNYDLRSYMDWWYFCMVVFGYSYMAILLYMFFVPSSWIWLLDPFINGETFILGYDITLAAYAYTNLKEKISNGAIKKRAGQWITFWWIVTFLIMIIILIIRGGHFDRSTFVGPPATASSALAASIGALIYTRNRNIIKILTKNK